MTNMIFSLLQIGYTSDNVSSIMKLYTDILKHLGVKDMKDEESCYAVRKALLFSADQHKGTFRRTGEPVILHPLRVACSVAKMLDEPMVRQDIRISACCAAILHDIVEDTDTSISDIEDLFGQTTAECVTDVSNLDFLQEETGISHEEADDLSSVKLMEAVSHNPIALMIKIADRMDNLDSILEAGFPYMNIRQKIAETFSILIPAASRISATQLVNQLEDMSFKVKDPKAYNDVKKEYYSQLAKYKEQIEENESAIIKPFNIDGSIMCHFELRTISDLYRLLNKNVSDYKGADHKFHINRNFALKDVYFVVSDDFRGSTLQAFFEACCKLKHENMCSDIEENRIDASGKTYFLYKGRGHIRFRVFVMREKEYMSRVHGNLLKYRSPVPKVDCLLPAKEMIRVSLRNGKCIDLPKGCSALDAAFAIHPEIAYKATGCLLNKKPCLLSTRLTDGDRIEILTDPDGKDHIHVRWFQYLHTKSATRALVCHFEQIPNSYTLVPVYYKMKNGRLIRFDIPSNATVIDFICFIDDKIGTNMIAHLKAVYVNKGVTPIAWNTTVRYGSQYRIETDIYARLDAKWMPVFTTALGKSRFKAYLKSRNDFVLKAGKKS